MGQDNWEWTDYSLDYQDFQDFVQGRRELLAKPKSLPKKEDMENKTTGLKPELKIGSKVQIISDAGISQKSRSTARQRYAEDKLYAIAREKMDSYNTLYNFEVYLITGNRCIEPYDITDVQVLPTNLQYTPVFLSMIEKEYKEKRNQIAQRVEEVVLGLQEELKCPGDFYELNHVERINKDTPYNAVCHVESGVFCDEKFIKYKILSHAYEILLAGQENGDLVIYFPAQPLESLGMTREIFIQYIEFINKMGFDVDLYFKGETSQPWHKDSPSKDFIRAIVETGKNIKTAFKDTPNFQNRYYEVVMKPSENSLLNYFVYSFLEILSGRTCLTAFLALQIEKELGIGPWQSFMLALIFQSPGRFYQAGDMDNNQGLIPDLTSPYNSVVKLMKTFNKPIFYYHAMAVRRVGLTIWGDIKEALAKKEFKKAYELVTTLPPLTEVEKLRQEDQLNPPKPVIPKRKGTIPLPGRGRRGAKGVGLEFKSSDFGGTISIDKVSYSVYMSDMLSPPSISIQHGSEPAPAQNEDPYANNYPEPRAEDYPTSSAYVTAHIKWQELRKERIAYAQIQKKVQSYSQNSQKPAMAEIPPRPKRKDYANGDAYIDAAYDWDDRYGDIVKKASEAEAKDIVARSIDALQFKPYYGTNDPFSDPNGDSKAKEGKPGVSTPQPIPYKPYRGAFNSTDAWEKALRDWYRQYKHIEIPPKPRRGMYQFTQQYLKASREWHEQWIEDKPSL